MNEIRVLLSFLINGFGSWMTFTALALMLNERFGSSHVAYSFLLQSIPSLLLVAPIIARIKSKWTYGIFHVSFLFSALTSLALIKANSIALVYFLTFLGSYVAGIRQPLFWSLATSWFQSSDRSQVNTRLASINGLTLCLAPPLGAWLSVKFGYAPLFVIDAITFIIASLLLISNKTQVHESIKTQAKSLTEGDLKTSTKHLIYLWYSFLIVGAFFNAIEFEGFNRAGLNKEGIGFVLGAWGLGSFLAFLVTTKVKISKKFLGFILVACYGSFPLLKSQVILLIVFLIGGWAFAQFTGELRSNLQSEEEKNNFRSVDFWSLVQKRLALINIIGYGSIGFLLEKKYWGISVGILFLALSLFGKLVLSNDQENPKLKTQEN